MKMILMTVMLSLCGNLNATEPLLNELDEGAYAKSAKEEVTQELLTKVFTEATAAEARVQGVRLLLAEKESAQLFLQRLAQVFSRAMRAEGSDRSALFNFDVTGAFYQLLTTVQKVLADAEQTQMDPSTLSDLGKVCMNALLELKRRPHRRDAHESLNWHGHTAVHLFRLALSIEVYTRDTGMQDAFNDWSTPFMSALEKAREALLRKDLLSYLILDKMKFIKEFTPKYEAWVRNWFRSVALGPKIENDLKTHR